MLYEFMPGAALSVFLVLFTILLFYEIMRIVWKWLPRVHAAPRKRIMLVVLAIFTGHTISVWVYGIIYWLLVRVYDFGSLAGDFNDTFFSYIYFSAATYSSLGLGDVYPTGGLRLLTGVEVLNGLVLIGWSVSFTYLAMQKFWDLHKGKKKDDKTT